LGATFGTGNMGVGALAYGALTVLVTRYPNADICFLDYDRAASVSEIELGGSRISIPTVNLRFSWKVWLPNNVAHLLLLAEILRFAGAYLRQWAIPRNRWLRAIAGADLAVAVSGGDSFSDIYGLGRFFYVCLPQLLVIALGKELILFPQTIGPFNGGLAKLVARYIMRRARVVYVRDRQGVGEVRALLKLKDDDQRVRFCYDLGFVVESRKPRDMDLGPYKGSTARRGLWVGLNVSGLLLMGGYSKENMFELHVNYAELIERLIAHLIEVKKASVLLIPHVFGSHEENDTFAVSTFHSKLGERYQQRLQCVSRTLDQNEIKYIIGQCEFFIGSRMHSCIAALSQEIPSVGIAYSEKFRGVFESIGVEQFVADPRTMSVREVLSLVDRTLDNRIATSEHLKRIMPKVRRSVLNLLTD